MANLTEISQWENVVRQLENGEAATGGADGLANIQAKQLANRTKWLKENLAPIINAAFSGTLKHENNDLAGSAIVAKSLGQNGYVKYASGLIMQWGIRDLNSAQITFPIGFSRIPLIIAHANRSTSKDWILVDVFGYDGIKCSYTIKSTEGFSYTGGDVNIHWFAIGV